MKKSELKNIIKEELLKEVHINKLNTIWQELSTSLNHLREYIIDHQSKIGVKTEKEVQETIKKLENQMIKISQNLRNYLDNKRFSDLKNKDL